jgi:hypothetical protein
MPGAEQRIDRSRSPWTPAYKTRSTGFCHRVATFSFFFPSVSGPPFGRGARKQ